MNRPNLWRKIKTRLTAWGRGRTLQQNGISFQRTGDETPPAKDGITVILNVYKRPGYLSQQIAALRAQTIPPAQIWVWCNDGGAPIPDFSELADRVIVSNHNWKFFGRFTLANLVQTNYAALFDDDILPQPMWFENCLNTIDSGNDGILGGSGILLPADGGYSAKQKIGWNGEQLTTAKTADLVGHAWFFRKAHLGYMWREAPYSWDNGEDIHLSCMAQKYGDIKTLVPPHPPDDMRLWSCDPEFGRIAGSDKQATYKRGDHTPIRNAAVNHYRQNGWKIINT